MGEHADISDIGLFLTNLNRHSLILAAAKMVQSDLPFTNWLLRSGCVKISRIWPGKAVRQQQCQKYFKPVKKYLDDFVKVNKQHFDIIMIK